MTSLKTLARDVAAGALRATGLTTPARRATGHLSIATFHRVLPEAHRREYPLRGLCVTPEELDWFVGYFDAHFTVGPLRDIARRFFAGERPPRPLLALTFDDGERDNFVFARPVLARRGVRASFYLPVAHLDEGTPIWHDRLGFALLGALRRGSEARAERFLDGPLRHDTVQARIEGTKSMSPEERATAVRALEEIAGSGVPEWAALMSWDEVRALHADGHEIGSHSMTHPLLPQCDDATLEVEIAGSKRRIEDALQVPIHTFCYPNGDTEPRVGRVVERAGYECAVTTAWGRNAPGVDRYALTRFDMHPEHARGVRGELSAPRLAWRMSGLHPGLRD